MAGRNRLGSAGWQRDVRVARKDRLDRPTGIAGLRLAIAFRARTMSLWQPTRRELIATSAALAGATAAFGQGTLRGPAPLNFLVVGDWGRDGGHYQRQVAGQMALEAARSDARFVCTTGDNFYMAGVASASDRQWATSFDEIYTDPSLHRPWYPVLGNHDYRGNVHAQIERSLRCPRWRMPDRWYSVRGAEHGRPELDLFFIDTVVWIGREDLIGRIHGSRIKGGDQARQHKWLEDELLASTAPLKLVLGHHPIYAIGTHGGRHKLRDLDRLLRRAGVTAYISGHDHCLYHIRSSAMDYVCSGGGAEELSDFSGDPRVSGCVIPGRCDAPEGAVLPRWLSFAGRAGFAAVSVAPDALSFRLIDRSGIVVHEQRIEARAPDPSVALEIDQRS